MKAQISKAACMNEDPIGLLPPQYPLDHLSHEWNTSELLVCSLG